MIGRRKKKLGIDRNEVEEEKFVYMNSKCDPNPFSYGV